MMAMKRRYRKNLSPKILKARERVLKAAKRWRKTSKASGMCLDRHCQITDCILSKAIDHLNKLEKPSNPRGEYE